MAAIVISKTQKDTIPITKDTYQSIDLMKYLAALMVIGVHTKLFMPFSDTLNFAFANVLARIAVPFFLITSAYFLKRGTDHKKNYLRTYLLTLLKGYLLWSTLYLPIGLNWISDHYDLPFYLYPIALVVGLFYVGTYYHLWYIPALIIAVLTVNWVLKKTNYPTLFGLAFLLYSLGSLETYYGVIKHPTLLAIIDHYMATFITTRNGLFYGVIFVAIGFFLWDYQDKLKELPYTKGLILSIALITVEACYIFDKTRLDMNFLLSLIPLSFFLFIYLKEKFLPFKINSCRLRNYAKYYYFIHAFFLVLLPPLAKIIGLNGLWNSQGLLRFALTLFATHLSCLLLIYLRQQSTLPKLNSLLKYM